ncbi:Small ubiquitin- modifier 1 [Datura stramonium]|uniref:Small ubiquitin- modifier 1 n=1 Tax=Datura stramonium TaxID=4076 RepID=A0ABS8SSH0_DATST|nr:Small ubiquitin- modifier 1 [Datura stramonium]
MEGKKSIITQEENFSVFIHEDEKKKRRKLIVNEGKNLIITKEENSPAVTQEEEKNKKKKSLVTQNEKIVNEDESCFITIHVTAQDGDKLYFKLKRDTPLKKLMKVYLDKKFNNMEPSVFLFESLKIKDDQTPDELGMKDGDEIDFMRHMNGGGWHIAVRHGSSLRILPGARRLHPGATGHATRQQQCHYGMREAALSQRDEARATTLSLHDGRRAAALSSSLRILLGARYLHPGTTGHATRQQQCRYGMREATLSQCDEARATAPSLRDGRRTTALSRRVGMCDAAWETRLWNGRREMSQKGPKIGFPTSTRKSNI